MQEDLKYSDVLLTQKSKDGENPQANLIDLAYLAGLWDGEGYIGIHKVDRKGKYRHEKVDYQLQMTIVNTDINIINAIIKILDKFGISAYLYSQNDNNPKHAVRYNITVRKKTAMKQLAELLIPFLVGKKSRAEILLRFINASFKRDKFNHTFTDEEIDLAKQLKDLNRKVSPQRPYVERSLSEEMVQSS